VVVLVVLLPAAFAIVPRTGLTRYAAAALESELYQALKREDLDLAERLLARASKLGHSSPWLAYVRAGVQEKRGDLDGAARGYDALANSSDPETRRRGASAAKRLVAWRLMNGDGEARDPERGRRLLGEICATGDRDVCEWLERNPIADAQPTNRGKRAGP
jgi:TPR repeat protein